MANSIITETGDGVTTQYPLNFTLGILNRDYVTCRVGSEVDGLGDPVYRTLEWITDGLVNIQGTVPGNGVPIVFKRTVPKNELIHDYSDGVPIIESNLDESNLQTMMAIHEFLDGRLEGGFVQDLNMSGFKITNLGDGTDPTDAVNLSQLEDMTGNAPLYAAQAAASAAASLASETNADASEAQALIYRDDSATNAAIAQAAVNGLAWKAPVRAATTANITLSAPQTIDGISVIAGDRVLVKNQSTASQNGIYLVAAGAWTRSTDMDTWVEFVSAAVIVQEGSTQADLEYRCIVNAGGTVGVTSVVWANHTATPAANSIMPSQINSASYASQAEAEAGAENTKIMTALRTYQQNTARIASVAEIIAGTPSKLLDTVNHLTYITENVTSPWVAYVPTFTGFGTVTAVEFWSRRNGDSLEVQGVFTSGTPTATEARVTMGFNGTNNNVTSAGAAKLPTTTQIVGPAGASSTGSGFNLAVLMERSVNYMTIGVQAPSASILQKANGNILAVAGIRISMTAKIPIAGW